MGCSEKAGSSGNGEAVLDELGDDDKDSDEIMSPNESKDDENKGNKKIARREFPKFDENLRPEDVKLVTGLLFTDKKQLKKAVQTYKIQNGYSLKVTKSDKQIYQRRPEKGEHSKKHFDSSGKVSRKGHKKTCSKSGVVGHTKTTCNKQVEVNHRASDSSRAPSQLDIMIMIPTP
ncbi:hypothetical protein Cgig2_016710 [Carnegiea gigantea]|uniref:Transposase MuDR plant domain-containing protein n=1 Tax=Carnegiea gigantea TaxID=171969 RepID=A0A9Q1QS47_9CARY|nr:hypothetical protein Cgig2_016710 [Carnegiea gigantea]